jgi:hypothetical protein
MAHCIQAFVTAPDVAKRLIASRPEAPLVELTPDLLLVPLTDSLFDAICCETPSEDIEPFWRLNQMVLDAVLGCAGDAAIGYFETDYFGGAGTQAAAVWKHRRSLVEPSDRGSPVNRMLAALGVKRSVSKDEFDSVGLGRFRTMDAFSP